jgi:hypothetical protein
VFRRSLGMPALAAGLDQAVAMLAPAGRSGLAWDAAAVLAVEAASPDLRAHTWVDHGRLAFPYDATGVVGAALKPIHLLASEVSTSADLATPTSVGVEAVTFWVVGFAMTRAAAAEAAAVAVDVAAVEVAAVAADLATNRVHSVTLPLIETPSREWSTGVAAKMRAAVDHFQQKRLDIRVVRSVVVD